MTAFEMFLALLLGTPMSDVRVSRLPMWYIRVYAMRCGAGARFPTFLSRERRRDLEERAARAVTLETRLAKWEASRPEDFVWVVNRGEEGRADVYDEKWRIDMTDGEEVADPRSAGGGRKVVFG